MRNLRNLFLCGVCIAGIIASSLFMGFSLGKSSVSAKSEETEINSEEVGIEEIDRALSLITDWHANDEELTLYDVWGNYYILN